MYGGSSKLSRGGGGGRGSGVPRNLSSFPPPPHRPSSATQSGRLPLGSTPRNRPGTGGASGPAPSVEESFSLVSGNNPLAFAMIIRLAPDLVEEIRRLEAQGETARIKFDSIPTHLTGNVIDVGGKEFKFTWSRELGALCDIYEKRQMGEDENDLLVEFGGAWRKLNVQRVLDESTTNQVKMRSEEAERMHKSRKAIILDHGNPSMKNQIKQLVAVEASPWKSNFKKEIASKKGRVDSPQAAVGGPPKSGYKPGLISAATAKGRHSSSPLPSPPERSGAASSPIGIASATKIRASSENVILPHVKSKENISSSSEKEILTRATNVVCEMQELSGGPKPTELQSLLISLLKENPKGMSLKARARALEKAVGDTIPNSALKIEPILKKFATFHVPGRYFLKPGVGLESLKKALSKSGSSLEDNPNEATAPEENQDQTSVPASLSVEKVSHDETEEHTDLYPKLTEESNALEQIDMQQHSPDLVGERKVSDNSEGPVNSATDSGSDSDSDSSDGGSHSRSKSRSASPAASGSSSSSDSESDASSNSKEGSDEDVDIMTSDDEKETKQGIPTSEPGLLTSPVPWQAGHDSSLLNGMDENQDDDGSDAIDIEGNGSDAVDIEQDLPEDEQEIGMAASTNKECEKHEEGIKPSSSDHDEFQEHQNVIGNLFDDTENMAFPRKSSTDFHQSGRKLSDPGVRTKAVSTAERPLKHAESSGPDNKFTRKNVHGGYVIKKDNPYRDTQNEDGLMNEKSSLTNPKGGARGKDAVPSDFQHRKHGETVGKSKDSVQISGSYINSSPKDNSRVSEDSYLANGKSNVLQRELSHLELGEIREPLIEETPTKKQFESKASVKQSGGRPSTSDNSNPDLSKGKPFGKANWDSGKSSSPTRSGLKRTPEHLVEDLSRSHHRVVQSQQQQQLSRFDCPEVGSQFNRLADDGKTKKIDTGAKLGVGLEDYSESHKKAPASALQQKESKRGPASQFMNESKIPATKKMLDTTDMRKDVVLKEGNVNGRKKRGSSDEDYLLYFKYEKDEQQHRGPIKDSSEYEEYVNEFREKYESYKDLDRVLQTYRLYPLFSYLSCNRLRPFSIAFQVDIQTNSDVLLCLLKNGALLVNGYSWSFKVIGMGPMVLEGLKV
ncbi:Dentin sialophosphoprotein-related, putative isoform 2 [Hibiscus syriacus]|uniref:Dentin sialophosphoprotein-related, putative isoform 2 n=1 Tax=Hibiscus syriacus TaxID=106335 RepID=A0A6A2Z986_HIBSY|nr:Dentin sialophosphoprotein-related, putative isoform 2 [Hibiscus syriacus]